ncbi:MAG: response regulator transcription factor [Chitinophagales bacterium]|nr:response regulator transcription factor [Chitinophagales bacterium]
MYNISCIITDDEPKMVELLSVTLEELFPEIEITGTYTDWKSAISGIKSNKPDILFLDISMPEKTGFDLLDLIPNLSSEIIFVTAHTEFALDAFNFDVCGYVLKPINEKQLVKAIERAKTRILTKRKAIENNESKSEKIGIPDDNGIRYVDIDDIIYCETFNRYTKVVTLNMEILSSYNIGRYHETLPRELFYQLHRSFIVNLNHVKRYDATGLVIMNDGTEIPISKKHKEDFLQMFNRVGR